VSTDLKNKGVQQQDDATLDQDSPVSGTKYSVLDTKGHKVRIKSICLTCTWTGQPTPLECHITIDGKSKTVTQADPVSGTPYYVAINADAVNPVFGTTDLTPYQAFLCEARSIKIEAEITGGTVSNLSARVKYAKR